jgi:hypothetical protein
MRWLPLRRRQPRRGCCFRRPTLQVLAQHRCRMLCRVGGSIALGRGGGAGRGTRRAHQLVQLLCLLGNGAESGREGCRVDRPLVGGREGLEVFFDARGAGAEGGCAVVVLRVEEGLREGQGGLAQRLECGCAPRHHPRARLHAPELPGELPVKFLCAEEGGLEVPVPLLEALDLEALTLPRGLGRAAVPKHTLDAALLLLVLCLGAFPIMG